MNSFRNLYKQIHDFIFSNNLPGKYRRTTRKKVSWKLAIMGVLNLLFFALSLYTFLFTYEFKVNYSSNFSKRIFLKKGKTFMYIQIDINQANLKYSKSISSDQLSGKENPKLKNTKPFDKINNKVIYPAGELADSYFQDKIILNELSNIIDSNIKDSNIINSNNISLNSDSINFTNYKPNQINIPLSWSKNTNKGTIPLNFKEGSKLDLPILNERFANWIYLSTFPKFKKLWGIINVPEDSEYILTVESINSGQKSIVFTDGSWLGLKNYWMALGFGFVGFCCVLGSFYISR